MVTQNKENERFPVTSQALDTTVSHSTGFPKLTTTLQSNGQEGKLFPNIAREDPVQEKGKGRINIG